MTLVSHRHEFVYLKSKKTAGTSIEMLLQPLCTTPDIPVTLDTETLVSSEGIVARRHLPKRRPSLLNHRYNRWREHTSARRVRRWIGKRKWSQYAKVTNVRNPFDRAVSQFCWNTRHHPISTAPFAERKDAFAAFVHTGVFGKIDNMLRIDGHLIVTDFIRYEHLKEDIANWATKFDVPVDLDSLTHQKRASSRVGVDLADWYDCETRDRILKEMAWVFEAFGYGIEPNCHPSNEHEGNSGIANSASVGQ